MAALAGTIDNGSKADIGLTAVRLVTVNPRFPTTGYQLRASPRNSNSIFVGGADVTVLGTADATDGMELEPGASLFLPINNLMNVWVISDAAAQRMEWIAI